MADTRHQGLGAEGPGKKGCRVTGAVRPVSQRGGLEPPGPARSDARRLTHHRVLLPCLPCRQSTARPPLSLTRKPPPSLLSCASRCRMKNWAAEGDTPATRLRTRRQQRLHEQLQAHACRFARGGLRQPPPSACRTPDAADVGSGRGPPPPEKGNELNCTPPP